MPFSARRLVPCLTPIALLAASVVIAGCASSPRSAELRLAPAERHTLIAESTGTLAPALAKRSKRVLALDPDVAFDTDRALADARAIAGLGVRPGGSEAESEAAGYIDRKLRSMGYATRVDTFPLPNGKTSRNVTAVAPGTDSARTIVVGAHFDTKPPSPGGNDNASGCGVALELARQLKGRPAPGEVRFVFYGTEEYLTDAPGDNHHLGSRFDAAHLSDERIGNIAAMLSIDMVGYGARPYVRTMKRGPMDFVEVMRAEAKQQGLQLDYRKDPGATGWSDHEPYELRGVPVAWLQWLEDPTYHTKKDDAEHIQRRPLDASGRLVLGVLRSLGASELAELCDR